MSTMDVNFIPMADTLKNMREMISTTRPEPTRLVFETYCVGGDSPTQVAATEACQRGVNFLQLVREALLAENIGFCELDITQTSLYLQMLLKNNLFDGMVKKKVELHRKAGRTMHYLLEMQLVKTQRDEYSKDLYALRVSQAITDGTSNTVVSVGTFETILSENVVRDVKPDISNLN